MDEAATRAKQLAEDIVSFFGLNTEVGVSLDEDVIELNVPSTYLNGFLIGNNGETLRAIQSIIVTTLRTHDYATSRVNLDIANYKKNRNDKLAAQAKEWAQQVLDSGEVFEVRPMNAAERRVVHQAVPDFSQELITESVGEGRDRHIIIKKK